MTMMPKYLAMLQGDCMDTDISHAMEERLAAIEARLDALDGGPDEPGDDEEAEEDEDASVMTTTPSRRGRKKDTVEESVEDTTTTEVSY